MSVFAERERAEEHETARASQPRAPLPVAPSHTSAITDEVVQRLAPTTIRRFTLDRPDFSQTERVTVFAGGGGGRSAKFEDASGRPLIVKVDQVTGHEVVTASHLHNQTQAIVGDVGGYSVSAPRTRLATQEERTAIAAVAPRKLVTGSRDPASFLDGLKPDVTQPTILMEPAAGKDLDSLDVPADHAPGAVSTLDRMLGDPGFLTTLASAMPADVVMGMDDRLLDKINLGNLMFDEGSTTFSFVDNTRKEPGGFLTSKVRDGALAASPESSFDVWLGMRTTKAFLSGPDALAELMWETMFFDISAFNGIGQAFKQATQRRAAKARVEALKPRLMEWMADGLSRGEKAVMAVLADPVGLAAGLPPVERRETVWSLVARRERMKGAKPEDAKATAEAEASKLWLPSAEPSLTNVKPSASSATSSSSASSAPSGPGEPQRSRRRADRPETPRWDAASSSSASSSAAPTTHGGT